MPKLKSADVSWSYSRITLAQFWGDTTYLLVCEGAMCCN